MVFQIKSQGCSYYSVHNVNLMYAPFITDAACFKELMNRSQYYLMVVLGANIRADVAYLMCGEM